MTPRTSAVVASVVVSWLGLVIHNVADLPGQTLASPETAYPTVVYLLAVGVWFTPARRVAAWLLLAWVLLNLLAGAILSVLPLPILPFQPEQTLYHYAFHTLYGLTQVPALVVFGRYFSRSGHATATRGHP